MQLEGKFNNVSLSVFATIAVNLAGDTFNIFTWTVICLEWGLPPH